MLHKRTKVMPEQLQSPDVPRGIFYLLSLFNDLSQGRQSGMGINAIQSIEIVAWMQITERKLCAWEIATLRAMDRGLING